jgi:hypothetical protein
MEDLRARTEIHEAWTNITLAGAHITQNKFREAEGAIRDAEGHYKTARDFSVAMPGPILDLLADLRTKLDQIRSEIRMESATRVRSAFR